MSWPLVQIGKYADKVRTWNPVAGAECVFQYVDLSSVDKSRKIIDLDNVAEISSADAPSRARQLLVEGDVLVATVRPNLNGVAVVPAELNGATASTGYCVLRADEKNLHGRYLFHWVQTGSFVEDMMSKATGANYPAVSDKIVKESKIPLPPLPEQKRIAAILDKADAIRRKRQQAIQLADDFLRAVFLDMFGDPVTNPKGWGLRKLSEVCRQITVGVVVKPASYYVESGVPAIRSLNIKNYGINRENFVFFSSEDNDTTLSKSRVYAGDLVIVRSGQPGKAAVVTKDLDGVNAIDVLIARPDSGYLNSDYLAYFFNSGAAKSIVLAEGRGQIQQHLNVGSLNAAEIPIPPLELQREFADILEKVKDKYLCSDEATYGDVFNSISQRAFSGQL